MHLYQDQFLRDKDFPESTETNQILIIATTGRSGSHMLGHALHKTGCFGFPLEYVNPSNLPAWQKRLGVDDVSEVIREIKKIRTSPNGVFSIKLHYSHIEGLGGFEGMQKLFPDAFFVHLTRKNILKQAISTVIAEQTGVWISVQKPKENVTTSYSFNAINRAMRQIVLDNASWKYFFEASGSRYIEMDFDELQKNLMLSIKKIAKLLDMDVDASLIPEEQVTKKQSTGLNEEWRQRFIEDYDKRELLGWKGLSVTIKHYFKLKMKRLGRL